MTISNLGQAIEFQIEINRFLVANDMKNLVGDYGELLIQKALGGTMQNAVNHGYDIQHDEYGRIEVKTRKYELKKGGGSKKEDRAVGFSGKENNFDWLAHVILDTDFKVIEGCLAKYQEVWPEIRRTPYKVGYSTSSNLRSSIDMTRILINAQNELFKII